jgi:hypothetical protein
LRLSCKFTSIRKREDFFNFALQAAAALPAAVEKRNRLCI